MLPENRRQSRTILGGRDYERPRGNMDQQVTPHGTIVQCIGAVVDVQFARDQMPRVYDALILEADPTNQLVEQGLTFEVQQQLGDGIVRTIAMGSSDGLKRG